MNFHNKYSLQPIWIGLARISEGKGSHLNANNAYVNVVGIAKSKLLFRKYVKDALERNWGLSLKRIESVELLNERLKKYDVDECILNLVSSLQNNSDIKFSTFHTFD
jgi:hypothetical protein